jgi:GNAT superfamily N-acetyltransferase
MQVRLASGDELRDARTRLAEAWGLPILGRGRAWDLEACEVLIAGDMAGLAAFDTSDKPIVELVAINAFTRLQGVGTALIAALVEHLGPEFEAIRLTTTNDNLEALRFYQRRGFRLTALRPGAVDAARLIKPTLPRIGDFGLPIRDEFDLVLDL